MKLQDLLSIYEEAIARGDTPLPEEICREHPEFLEQFKLHAQAMRLTPAPVDAAGPNSVSAEESASSYLILKPHARGGLGEVYLARDQSLGRDVAVKVMSNPGEKARRCFEREAAITAKLQHPGIVPVYGTGVDDQGRPCHFMRFISGPTLAEAIEEFHSSGAELARTNPKFRQLLTRLVQIAQTIAFAHSKGVIHRDLKPGNVILGEFGETLVVDWGLARDLKIADKSENEPSFSPVASEITQAGTLLGTPAFASPEQARGEEATIASDIFALGGHLYTLLTKQPPNTKRDKSGEISHATAVRPGVPAALAAVAQKALSTNPTDRYSDALTFAAELERWIADEPLASVADPFSVRARRWARRHRLLVSSTSAAVIVAALGAAIAAMMLTEKNRDLKSAIVLAEANAREADDNGKEALDNFNTACDAVDRFTVKVSEDPRLKKADLEKLRKDLLASATVFYRQLAERRGDRPQLLSQIINAHIRLGAIAHETGDVEGADRERRKALTLLQEYPGPRDADRVNLESRTWFTLSTALQQRGKTRDALEAHRKAMALREESHALNREPDEQTGIQFDLWLARLLSDTEGDTEATNAAFNRAFVELRRLRHDHPDDFIPWRQLPLALNDYAYTKARAEKYSEAAAAWTEARTLYRSAPPLTAPFQDSYGKVCFNLAQIELQAGRTAGAEAPLKEAISIYEKLHHAQPAVVFYRTGLAENTVMLARVLRELGKLDEAEPLLKAMLADRLSAYQSMPEVMTIRHTLIECRMERASLDLARKKVPFEELEETMKLLKPVAEDNEKRKSVRDILLSAVPVADVQGKETLFNRALDLAAIQAVLKPPELAMKLVKSIANAGGFQNTSRYDRLMGKEFQPLHEMPEFQSLRRKP